jgi:RsiW-degrading membrane proteinase PrsW (M82 family)
MARRWSWVLVLLVGIALYEIVVRAVVTTGNPNLLPALILLGAAVVPAAFVAFVYGRRFRYDIHGGLLGLTALIGGVVGVAVAGTWEYHTLLRLGGLPMFAVGVVEETAKLIVPAAVLVFVRRRRPADGLLLGVASGAGFAALETMGYAFVTLIQSKGDLGAVDGLLLLRGLLSPAGHMAWTGLSALALWHAAAHRWRGRGIAQFLAVYVVVVLLHTAWDSLHTFAAYAVLAVLSLALLVVAAHRVGREDPAALAPAVPRG